ARMLQKSGPLGRNLYCCRLRFGVVATLRPTTGRVEMVGRTGHHLVSPRPHAGRRARTPEGPPTGLLECATDAGRTRDAFRAAPPTTALMRPRFEFCKHHRRGGAGPRRTRAA